MTRYTATDTAQIHTCVQLVQTVHIIVITIESTGSSVVVIIVLHTIYIWGLLQAAAQISIITGDCMECSELSQALPF